MARKSEILENFIREEVVAGRVAASGGGDGRVWVPGINNGAMDALLRQMAAAGLLTEMALRVLGLTAEGKDDK